MSLKYTKIVSRPTIFLRLFGVNPVQFHEILVKISPLWQRHILGKYKRPGRNFDLSLEDMLLMVLLYYRTYSTQIFIGFLFGLDDSRVFRTTLKGRIIHVSKSYPGSLHDFNVHK